MKRQTVTTILLLIVITVLIYFLRGELKSSMVDVDKYENEIQRLQMQVDSLEYENSQLEGAEMTIWSEMTAYKQQTEELQQRIKGLKKRTNEILESIDNYTDDELVRFFADRYRHYEDSIRKADSPSGN